MGKKHKGEVPTRLMEVRYMQIIDSNSCRYYHFQGRVVNFIRSLKGVVPV